MANNKKSSNRVVEDIWMNTRAEEEMFDQIDHEGPEGWDEVEEANMLLNPDLVSMESRG